VPAYLNLKSTKLYKTYPSEYFTNFLKKDLVACIGLLSIYLFMHGSIYANWQFYVSNGYTDRNQLIFNMILYD